MWETRGNVWLDRCPDCKGLWFDAGELQRVRAADGEASESLWSILKKKLFG
jgi:Zn-finger nucleic acid-binding protein